VAIRRGIIEKEYAMRLLVQDVGRRTHNSIQIFPANKQVDFPAIRSFYREQMAKKNSNRRSVRSMIIQSHKKLFKLKTKQYGKRNMGSLYKRQQLASDASIKMSALPVKNELYQVRDAVPYIPD
jgi:hypothetical protein